MQKRQKKIHWCYPVDKIMILYKSEYKYIRIFVFISNTLHKVQVVRVLRCMYIGICSMIKQIYRGTPLNH